MIFVMYTLIFSPGSISLRETFCNNCFCEFKVIPVAIGQQVDPDRIQIPPNEDVITDPEPEIGRPDILVISVMRAVLRSKEDDQLDNS